MIGRKSLILFSLFLFTDIVRCGKIRTSDFELKFENAKLKSVKKLRDLVELDLSNLGIEEIDEWAFKKAAGIKDLNLESNKISDLDEDTFSGLGSTLETLNLGSNDIRFMDFPFTGLKKLKTLNLSNNPLPFLEAGDLSGVPQRADIIVKNNNLKVLSTRVFDDFEWNDSSEEDEEDEEEEESKLKSKSKSKSKSRSKSRSRRSEDGFENELETLAEITHLHIVGDHLLEDKDYPGIGRDVRQIICIEDYVLTNVSFIEKDEILNENCTESDIIGGTKRFLDLQGLEIQEVGEGWYQLGEDIPIGFIDLSKNNLTQFSPDIVKDLPPSVKILDLSENSITEIRNEDFGNENIKAISFRSNLIEIIEDRAFESFENLWGLYLNDNKLSDILFASSLPSNLSQLFLNKNEILNISYEALARLDKLEYLKLEDNQISEIEPNAFDGLSSLEELNLGNNKISKIGAKFPPGLKSLDLSCNEISEIESGLFVGVPKKRLNLNKNNISEIFSTDFMIDTLEELNLGNNLITEINSHTFKHVKKIRELVLKGNLITEILPRTVIELEHLKSFDISSNPIVKLENAAFEGMSRSRFSQVLINDNVIEIIEGGVFESLIRITVIRRNF